MVATKKPQVNNEYQHVVVSSPDGRPENLSVAIIDHLDELDDWSPSGVRLALIDQYGHVSRPKEQSLDLYQNLSWLNPILDSVEFYASFYITKQFELKYVWC